MVIAQAKNRNSTVIKHQLGQLDLSFIINKMTSSTYELPRWPEDLAKQAVQLYKDFLWLHYKYPHEKLVPTRDIDECWHLHILNTKHYAKDCLALFGEFFHHNPSNLEDADELAELLPLFQKTQILYEKEFNRPLMVLKQD